MATNSSGRGRGMILVLGVVFIAIAAGGVALAVSSSASQSYSYCTAKVTIPAATQLTSAMVDCQSTTGKAPGGAEFLTSDTIGQYEQSGFTARTILPNDVLQKSDFIRPPAPGATFDPKTAQTVQRFSDLVSGSERAIVIIGDPTTSFLTAGDKIDIFWVGVSGSSPNTLVARRLMTKTVLYTVPVVPPAAGSQPSGTEIILGLTDQEAQNLLYASYIGDLRIAIVSPLDKSTDQVCQTDETYFANTFGIVLPQPVTATPTLSFSTPAPLASGATPAPVATPAPTIQLPGASPAASGLPGC